MKKLFALTVMIVILLSACASPAPAPTEAPATVIVPSDTPTEDPGVTVEFVNNAGSSLELFWVDFDGIEQSYQLIVPGTSFQVGSFPGHIWHLRDEQGNFITETIVTEELQQTVTLTEEIVSAALAPKSVLSIQVPTAGNSWVQDDFDATTSIITDQGVLGWTTGSGTIVTYVWLPQPGDLDIALNASVPAGFSTIKVTVGTLSKTVTFNNTDLQQVYVGSFPVDAAGYTAISMHGIVSTTPVIADVSDLFVGGTATQGTGSATGKDRIYFNNDPENFYWARRGPSVHLFYQLPTQAPVEWFYTEVTVPVGQDVIGTYAMATGFDEGYFGMQVNSPTERKILFSIWSPYETDDPTNVPEEYRIEMLRAGDGVITGEFGAEGSGGQSYLPYMWQAGQTYKFLVSAAPVENDSTVYTAYFFAPELDTWSLIASFRRPMTQKYLVGEYSFLENFEPSAGQFTRQALYGNQWVRAVNGQWMEVTSAFFSYDNTADQKWRLDYQGGVQDGQFYLKNCGFFSEFSIYGTILNRPALGVEPDVDLGALP